MKLGGKHYEGIHKVQTLNSKELILFKKLLEDKKCNIFDRISVVYRIGSESLYATVWEIDFSLKDKPLKMAIKVQQNIEKSLEEIKINNFLSTLSDYFLQTYGSIYCNKIELNEQIFDGYFIFMELAVSDLAQFLLSSNVSENHLNIYISHVFDSIYIMGKFQLFHGDLHLKNVFIVQRGNYLKAVIGDFGETMGIDSITSHTSDIYKFCTSLLEFLNGHFKNKYNTTKRKLNEIVKYTNRLTPKLESDYDKFNEKYRDDDGNVDLVEIDNYFDYVVGNTILSIKKLL